MKEKKSFAQRVHLMIREIVNHSADEKSHIPFSGGSDTLPVAWCLALALKMQVAEPSGGLQVDVLELVRLTRLP